MPLPDAKKKLIQQGYSCNVAIYDDAGTRKVVGLVTNASYNEDFNVVPANVIGFFGAISLDAQNYNCTITLGAYVPLKPKDEIVVPFLDGGTTTLAQQLKTRSEIALTGKGTVLSQIDFVDTVEGTIYNSFNQAIITSNGTSITSAAYVTQNISLVCIERMI